MVGRWEMEWAKDGGMLYMVQERPETVASAHRPATLKAYRLKEGASAACRFGDREAIAVCVIRTPTT